MNLFCNLVEKVKDKLVANLVTKSYGQFSRPSKKCSLCM